MGCKMKLLNHPFMYDLFGKTAEIIEYMGGKNERDNKRIKIYRSTLRIVLTTSIIILSLLILGKLEG